MTDDERYQDWLEWSAHRDPFVKAIDDEAIPLTDLHRKILALRWGKQHTFFATGEWLGLSRDEVRHLHNEAEQIIRDHSAK